MHSILVASVHGALSWIVHTKTVPQLFRRIESGLYRFGLGFVDESLREG